MSRLDNINEQRQRVLERLRERNINPYPNKFARSHTTTEAISLLEKAEAAGTQDKTELQLGGRITAMRKMGKSSFLDLRDGSGRIQLLMRNADFNEEQAELFKDIDIGDIIGVRGTVMRTRTGEPTILVTDFVLLAKSLRPLPEKWHGLTDTETRYRQRYLDLIANTAVKDIFTIRSRTITAIRSFLNNRGFLEVETPILNPSAGGALATPFVTHHNALDRDFYLRIALELHLKRLIVGGFDKVYEIGRVFRNEGIDTTHSPEFTMLESYEAYADYRDVMNMVEEMVSTVAHEVLGTMQITYDTHTIDLTPPWPRIPLRDAVKEYSGIDFVSYPTADGLRERMRAHGLEADPNLNWAKLVDELYKTCVRPKIIQPTFLYDYPVSMSPLAKTKPGEDRVVERFQAIVGGGLEIANAYSELNNAAEQESRFRQEMSQMQKSGKPCAWPQKFLGSVAFLPECTGIALGVDRLVMLLCDAGSIDDVIAFPSDLL